MGGAVFDGGQGVADGEVAVVVDVDADGGGNLAFDGLDGVGDLARQAAAVGVAEDEAAGAGFGGGLEGFEGVVGVFLVAVEEVFSVVNDFLDVGGEVGDGVGDHADVLVERDAQNLAGVEVPALADDGDDLGTGSDESAQAGVVLGGGVASAGHAEGGDAGAGEVEVADGLEVGGVLGVGERVAAFDVVDTQLVEALGDEQFVLEREVDPLALAAVSQGGVVDGDPRHVRSHWVDSGVRKGIVANVAKTWRASAGADSASKVRQRRPGF